MEKYGHSERADNRENLEHVNIRTADFTKRHAPIARQEQAARLKMIRLRREIGLIDDEGERLEIQEAQKSFEDRFGKQEIAYTQEALDVRSVEQISEKEKVIFVHAVPLDIDESMNTQMNNPVASTSKMSVPERIGMIVHEDISVSCSTVPLGTEKQYGKKVPKTMYPFGVVIDSGTVLSAHRYDGGISTVSKTAKHRKYDKGEQDVSVQPNIAAQLEYALHGPFSDEYERELEKKHGHINKGSQVGTGSDYNEIVVEKPKVSGFYIDADKTYEAECVRERQMHSDARVCDPVHYGTYNFEGFRWREMKKILAEFPDVPVYIREHGQVKEYICTDGELKPIQEEGKIEKTLPTHRVDEYQLPHATEHFYTKNKEREVENAKENGTYSFAAHELGKIIDQRLYNGVAYAEGRAYSTSLAQILLLAFVDSGNTPIDEIVRAVVVDYEVGMNKLWSEIKEAEARFAKEKIHTPFTSDGYIAMRKREYKIAQYALEGFLETIGKVHPNMAAAIKKELKQ